LRRPHLDRRTPATEPPLSRNPVSARLPDRRPARGQADRRVAGV